MQCNELTTSDHSCWETLLPCHVRYGSKLNFEKELGLRLKGENGIMKKKFSALQKDIEDQREEIRTMFAHKKELYQVINAFC